MNRAPHEADEDVRTVDLNADAGESFGPWRMGDDAALFPYLTSVNVACGFHAGDPATMRHTVRLALEHGVAVGAHPGYPDLPGFGRRELTMDARDLHAAVVYQIGALHAFVRAEGARLHHVKAHGALHHRSAVDDAVADAVARAVADAGGGAPLVVLGGPAGARMRAAAERAGVPVVPEAFPDRAYLADGRLTPRSLDGAWIGDPDRVAARAVRMVRDGRIEAWDEGETAVEARTLCVHGDHDGAPAVARAVRDAAEAAGFRVATYR